LFRTILDKAYDLQMAGDIATEQDALNWLDSNPS